MCYDDCYAVMSYAITFCYVQHSSWTIFPAQERVKMYRLSEKKNKINYLILLFITYSFEQYIIILCLVFFHLYFNFLSYIIPT